MIQESDDVFGALMNPGLRRKTRVFLDLAVPPGKFCHSELEGHVSTILKTERHDKNDCEIMTAVCGHNTHVWEANWRSRAYHTVE
jgi:hypothetical protein